MDGTEHLSFLFTPLIPVASGFAGVLLGSWLSSRRDQSQRRLAFVEKQLSGFYSPMQGLREDIASTSAIRLRIQQEAERAWRDVCAQAPKDDLGAVDRLRKERADEFNRIIEFDTDKLQKELLPAYRRMANLFRESYWLAEKETRAYFPAVLEFVEIWERWIAGTLPIEVWRNLNHTEDNLAGFYQHISSVHDELRSRLERGSA
jgi:hypothetical protein